MMATSLVISGSFCDRLERERDDLVAVGVGGERHHGQIDLLAELQLGGIVLGQPALDTDGVAELYQAHPERHEILAGGTGVGSPGRETLRGPSDDGALARQQQLAHLSATAAWAALLDGEGSGAAIATLTADQLRVLVRPGRDLGGECLLHRVVLRRT